MPQYQSTMASQSIVASLEHAIRVLVLGFNCSSSFILAIFGSDVAYVEHSQSSSFLGLMQAACLKDADAAISA